MNRRDFIKGASCAAVAVASVGLAALPVVAAPVPVPPIPAWCPPGWLPADGRAISRTVYRELFAVIGTTYGPGDGQASFNLPDFRSRHAVGVGDNWDWSDPNALIVSVPAMCAESGEHKIPVGGVLHFAAPVRSPQVRWSALNDPTNWSPSA